MQLPCVILCGGKSSRMGSDKALLNFKNQSLVTYQYNKMSSLFKEIYISAKKSYENLPLLKENQDSFSPLFGILNAFETLHTERIFFICVDTPFITLSNIQKLIDSMPNQSLIHFAKTPKNKHFLTSIWHKKTTPLIKKCLQNQEYKISKLFEQCQVSSLEYHQESEFFNLNTQEQYLLALKEITNG